MVNVNYREVKRKAAVGERIKIVAPFMAVGYGLDDEFTVRLVDGDDSGDVRVPRYDGGGDLRYIAYREYVVLEPVTPAEPDALAANFRQFVLDNADAIRAILPQVEALATKAPAQLTPVKPLTRAEVIAKASADVAELTTNGQRYSEVLPPGSCCYGLLYNVKFRVNRDKRVVVCEILGRHSGRKFAKGSAKAAPDDVFHAEIGKAIALRRALGLEIPEEYVNAPKPEKAEVGTVVLFRDYRVTARPSNEYGVDYTEGTAHAGSIAIMGGTIIDDTDVDYTKEAA